MTFLAPGYLFASLAVTAVIVGLHFIVTRQPRASVLPTARFVPDTRATTIAPANRPSDLLLLLLRVLTILAAGAALARPVLRPSRQPSARVVVVDVSRAAKDSLAIRDSVRASYRQGDALVVFDSAAHVVAENVGDSVDHLAPTLRRGNLSAALISAMRAGSTLRDRADSLELVIVSPFAREELNAATDSIRRLWPGRARLVRAGTTATSEQPTLPGRIAVSAGNDDPLAITASMVRPAVGTNALIDRSVATTNSWPVTVAGGALIDWPSVARPRGAIPRGAVDSVGGVTTADETVIAPFGRRWSFPADSLRGAEVIARWGDGEPAAIERSVDSGCLRSIAIPVADVGDLAIRRDFVRFVGRLSQPCARFNVGVPASQGDVARLAGSGGLAPRSAFQSPTDAQSSLAPWLLALAILAAIAELFVRRRQRDEAVRERASASREARAA